MIATVAIHRDPSLITLRSACDDPSGGSRPAQIPQLDTPQASKKSHNSIHNHKYDAMHDRQVIHVQSPITCLLVYHTRSQKEEPIQE